MKNFTYLFFAMLMSVLSWQGIAQIAGESCSNPIVVSLPFTASGNTATYGNNYGSADVPATAPGAITDGTGSDGYLNGDDVVFAYTPTSNQLIDVTTTNDNSWIGLWAFTGCPFTSTVGYHTATSGTTRAINNLPVASGTTYYFVISTWPSPQSTDFTISIIDVTPSCMAPIALATTGLSTTTADIEWTAGSAETAWNISWGTPGYTPGDADELGTATANATSYQVAGLTPGTKYDVYVQADCGVTDGVSDWTGPLSFTTVCAPIISMFEDFDSYGTGSIVPDCWERLTSATSSGSQTISSASPASGTRNIYQYTGTTSNSVIVVLPEFSNIDAGTHWLRLQARVSSGTGTLSVGYVTDITDYNSFTLIEDITITNTSYGTDSEYTVEVPNTVPAGARLGIKNEANATGHYWDDVYWEPIPTCLWPTALATTDISPTTADIEWTAGGTETSWNISWGTPGYTPGDADEISTATASANSYQITGLTAQTDYDVYVQADCGAVDGVSTWAGPLEVFTGYCQPTYGTSTSDRLSVFSTDGAVQDISYTAGVGGDHFDETSMVLEVYAGQSIDVNTAYVGGSQTIGLWVDWNENLIFGDVDPNYDETVFLNYAASPQSFVMIIPNVANGDYMMRVRGSWSDSVSDGNDFACNNKSYGSSVDFTLRVVDAPSCLAPTALATAGISTTTADIEWTAGGTETSWNISWGTPGYTPGDADEIATATANTTTYQITGLTADTHYDVYIQADCVGDESAWAGPLEVFTGYCIPTNTGTYYLSNVSTTGAQVDINHTATSRATDGYADLSQTDIVTASAGDTFELTVSANTSSHYFFVWIDLDNDMVFDPATETVVNTSSGSYSLGFTEQITIPTSLPNGDYRVRIGSSWSASSPDPCGPANGEYKDFTLSIVSPVVCDAVTNLDVTAITQTTAIVSWTASATAIDGYVVDVYEAGTSTTTVFTDTLVAGTTTATITGLSANTAYDVYVVSDCGNGDVATPAAFTFTTESCDAVTNIDVMAITQTTATVTWTASATASDGYEVNVYEASTTTLVTTETATATETSVDLTGLEVATSYDVVVTSDCGEMTVDSDVFTFTTDSCDAVTNIDVIAITQTTATVTWTASATASDGYEVNVYEAGTTTLVTTETATATETSVDLTGLEAATSYDVVVTSDCGEMTVDSDVFTFTTEAFVCDAVTNVVVTEITAETATVSWTASTTAVDGYKVDVYEAEADISTATPIYTETVATGITTVDVTGLTHLTSYDVYVTSNCGDGVTAISDVVSFTTEDIASVGDFNFANLEIFPNPASTNLNISAAKVIEEIQVYNVLGQLVMTQQFNDTNVSLDVSNLTVATYLLKVKVDGVLGTVRFVKK